jgi:dienelactone hydrolase
MNAINTVRTLSAALALAVSADAFAGNIRTESVSFDSNGARITGTLFLPEKTDGKPLPAVVVTGAWMTVKEQMPYTYARELAERGYAALAFDFRGWGQSAGTPRNMESPTMKIADINAAVAYLDSRKDIDDNRINGLGICASSGYMASVAASNPKLSNLALVAPWLHDAAIVEQVYGGKDGVAKLIATSRSAETANRNGKPQLVPAASKTDRSAVMFDVPYYTEADRGMIPAWDNKFNLASWEGWLTFDALQYAPNIDKPTLLVHSEAAAIPQGAKQFAKTLTGPVREVWLDNVGQLDFYDREQPVNRSADAVAAFFTANTKQTLALLGAPETSKVISVVSSIPLAVDLARYDLAEAAFAPQIVIDYTSLWGGEPQTMTPAALMDAWRGIVPGFSATWHELSNVRAFVDGDRATATAAVDGRHWLDGQLWRPVGHYHWELSKIDGAWKVTKMQFAMTQEIGDRSVAQQAMARAKALTAR